MAAWLKVECRINYDIVKAYATECVSPSAVGRTENRETKSECNFHLALASSATAATAEQFVWRAIANLSLRLLLMSPWSEETKPERVLYFFISSMNFQQNIIGKIYHHKAIGFCANCATRRIDEGKMRFCAPTDRMASNDLSQAGAIVAIVVVNNNK